MEWQEVWGAPGPWERAPMPHHWGGSSLSVENRTHEGSLCPTENSQ